MMPGCWDGDITTIREKGIPMKIELAAVVAAGVAAALLGLGAPAQAIAAETRTGIDHLDWLDDIRPKVTIPNVDSNVKHREIVLPLPN